MAVIGTAQEIAGGRESVIGENGKRNYRRMFVVLTDSPYDDGNIVKAAPMLPGMYETYVTAISQDQGARVVGVHPQQVDGSRQVWHVAVDYSTEYERIDNPLTEPPEIHYGSEVFQEPLPGMPSTTFQVTTEADKSDDLNKIVPTPDAAKSAFGFGILNSAGSPYNPPAERQASRPVVTYTVNMANFSAAYKLRWEGTVNKNPWNGLTYRQAFLRTVDAQSHVFKSTTYNVPDVYYYRVSFTFVLRAETWDLQVLDYGPYYLKWNSGLANPSEVPDKIPFVTADGTPYMGLLDHSNSNKPGSKLAERTQAQYNRFPVYREEDFGQLGINLNLALPNLKTPKVRG